MESAANTHQVSGEHYRALNAQLQHWDLVAETGMGYFEAQITRYVARWRRKAGRQDLEKALHYADKLTELVTAGRYPRWTLNVTEAARERAWAAFARFAQEQQLTRTEQRVFELCINRTGLEDLTWLRAELAQLLKEADTERGAEREAGDV